MNTWLARCYTRSMEKPIDKTSSTLDLCCGGNCPVLHDEGDSFVISDSDQSEKPIRITREQAALVAAWLAERLA